MSMCVGVEYDYLLSGGRVSGHTGGWENGQVAWKVDGWVDNYRSMELKLVDGWLWRFS